MAPAPQKIIRWISKIGVCFRYSLDKTDPITKNYIQRQLCCLGMSKISLWSDKCKRRYKQTYFNQIWNLVGRAPRDAYMCQWSGQSRVHVMACRPIGASHYLNRCWLKNFAMWTLSNKIWWNIFFQEIHRQMSSARCRSLCSGFEDLNSLTPYGDTNLCQH